ncbi:tRNA modification GTPase MnmE, partial [Dissostichus eleginoides]
AGPPAVNFHTTGSSPTLNPNFGNHLPLTSEEGGVEASEFSRNRAGLPPRRAGVSDGNAVQDSAGINTW